ncbi:hypothetical protein J3L14_20235 [Burkholderia pseudomallei]|uniref:hypothetical protein n=1 Tax=Burkholderia pseudomallei TaxID=28450 RepID=UPI0010FAA5D0|nr:hypothetical protein [Burkholderia pseudomallei]MBF3420286.1 hypothetical protein [Burkholderia pseudomallei]QTB82855.1 hypothetical protein J3L14_20235 [Burkholderia pseudomallei]
MKDRFSWGAALSRISFSYTLIEERLIKLALNNFREEKFFQSNWKLPTGGRWLARLLMHWFYREISDIGGMIF